MADPNGEYVDEQQHDVARGHESRHGSSSGNCGDCGCIAEGDCFECSDQQSLGTGCAQIPLDIVSEAETLQNCKNLQAAGTDQQVAGGDDENSNCRVAAAGKDNESEHSDASVATNISQTPSTSTGTGKSRSIRSSVRQKHLPPSNGGDSQGAGHEMYAVIEGYRDSVRRQKTLIYETSTFAQGNVCLSLLSKDQNVTLSRDQLTMYGFAPYFGVRATHGAVKGAFFFESYPVIPSHIVIPIFQSLSAMIGDDINSCDGNSINKNMLPQWRIGYSYMPPDNKNGFLYSKENIYETSQNVVGISGVNSALGLDALGIGLRSIDGSICYDGYRFNTFKKQSQHELKALDEETGEVTIQKYAVIPEIDLYEVDRMSMQKLSAEEIIAAMEERYAILRYDRCSDMYKQSSRQKVFDYSKTEGFNSVDTKYSDENESNISGEQNYEYLNGVRAIKKAGGPAESVNEENPSCEKKKAENFWEEGIENRQQENIIERLLEKTYSHELYGGFGPGDTVGSFIYLPVIETNPSPLEGVPENVEYCNSLPSYVKNKTIFNNNAGINITSNSSKCTDKSITFQNGAKISNNSTGTKRAKSKRGDKSLKDNAGAATAVATTAGLYSAGNQTSSAIDARVLDETGKLPLNHVACIQALDNIKTIPKELFEELPSSFLGANISVGNCELLPPDEPADDYCSPYSLSSSSSSSTLNNGNGCDAKKSYGKSKILADDGNSINICSNYTSSTISSHTQKHLRSMQSKKTEVGCENSVKSSGATECSSGSVVYSSPLEEVIDVETVESFAGKYIDVASTQYTAFSDSRIILNDQQAKISILDKMLMPYSVTKHFDSDNLKQNFIATDTEFMQEDEDIFIEEENCFDFMDLSRSLAFESDGNSTGVPKLTVTGQQHNHTNKGIKKIGGGLPPVASQGENSLSKRRQSNSKKNIQSYQFASQQQPGSNFPTSLQKADSETDNDHCKGKIQANNTSSESGADNIKMEYANSTLCNSKRVLSTSNCDTDNENSGNNVLDNNNNNSSSSNNTTSIGAAAVSNSKNITARSLLEKCDIPSQGQVVYPYIENSFIIFFVNGEPIAKVKNLRVGRYYPTVSSFMFGATKTSFGPKTEVVSQNIDDCWKCLPYFRTNIDYTDRELLKTAFRYPLFTIKAMSKPFFSAGNDNQQEAPINKLVVCFSDNKLEKEEAVSEHLEEDFQGRIKRTTEENMTFTLDTLAKQKNILPFSFLYNLSKDYLMFNETVKKLNVPHEYFYKTSKKNF